ncbi:hypothetical protein GCK72_011198 [Caenorhabditis remanei]|uniref:Uncharacterized protein n=1 Tax=Caenorhabditis remanei TaxID=31234 RepID=A0A6A5H921_CAERE|nr:hypothetical protein GCK72_011198 [Caenorhabditis remanei]KAF1762933.1 hypothetical protein GCK72_011198 [Caenorhabditis remanei]
MQMRSTVIPCELHGIATNTTVTQVGGVKGNLKSKVFFKGWITTPPQDQKQRYSDCLRPYRNPFGGTSCQEEVKKDFEALRRYPQMPISGYPIYRLTTRKYYQDTNDKEDFSTHTRLKDTARSSIHLWMSRNKLGDLCTPQCRKEHQIQMKRWHHSWKSRRRVPTIRCSERHQGAMDPSAYCSEMNEENDQTS